MKNERKLCSESQMQNKTKNKQGSYADRVIKNQNQNQNQIYFRWRKTAPDFTNKCKSYSLLSFYKLPSKESKIQRINKNLNFEAPEIANQKV